MATKKPTLRERAEKAERELQAAGMRESCLRWYVQTNNHFPPSNTWIAVQGPRGIHEAICHTDNVGMINQVILRGTREEQDEENHLVSVVYDSLIPVNRRREVYLELQAFRRVQATLRAA